MKSVVRDMARLLDRKYKGAKWDKGRTRPDPLDSLVRTILSQNTTDENRDRAFNEMQRRFPTWESVMNARPEDLKESVRVAGLANQKAPSIQSFLKWLNAEKGRLDLGFIKDLPVNTAIETLKAHKGVGIKTVYIVLAFAFDKDLCAVDTHVHRILKRVGIIQEKCGREKAHDVIAPLIPKGKARVFHMNLVDFGKDICTARKPACEVCPLSHMCNFHKKEVGTNTGG
jgi:endonuclease-3